MRIELHPRLHPALRFYSLLAEHDPALADTLREKHHMAIALISADGSQPTTTYPEVAAEFRAAYYEARVRARRLPQYAHLPFHPGDRVVTDDGDSVYIVDYGPEASDGHLGTDSYLVNASEPEYDEPGTCRWMTRDEIKPMPAVRWAVHTDGALVSVAAGEWADDPMARVVNAASRAGILNDDGEAIYDDAVAAAEFALALKLAAPVELVTVVLWTEF